MMRLARTLVLSLALGTLSLLGGGAARAAPPEANAPVEGSGVVNLNSASEIELALLPGVGPSKAQAIVAWRKKYGSFKKVEDLTKVRGFGRKTFLRLRPNLAVAGPTTFKGRKAAAARTGLPGRPPAMEAP